mmetsp:Transcript_30355/g.62536  ORF Transcript_30355/g.62536 Transcript_30355/m.62536 type:complete len:549 (+) Transcript_30355:55-1701(+)
MANSGPAGHPEFIEDADRKVVGKELLVNQSPNSPVAKQGAKSPRTKFVKSESTQRPAVLDRSSGLVTVQEEHAVLKEWSAVKTEKHEKFKSPALFWEIRLKESNVKAVEKVSARPSAFQLVEACHVLEQYSERVELSGDGVLSTIKEQLFSAAFADYNANQRHSYASRRHLLQSCVPYYVIAERQHTELLVLKRKLTNLERQLHVPSSRSYNSSGTQTVKDEMDIVSGMSKLKALLLEKEEELTQKEAERFTEKLEADEWQKRATSQIDSLTEQVTRLTAKETAIRSKWEMEKAQSDTLREQVIKMREENDRLKDQLQLLNNEMVSMRFTYDKKVTNLSETLKKERKRFTQERADWLDSLIFERYDLLNFTEQAAKKKADQAESEMHMRNKKSKSQMDLIKKNREEDDLIRANLWKGMLEVERKAKGALEELYNAEKESVKIADDAQHVHKVREVLRQQETKLEELLITAPQLHGWYDLSTGMKKSDAKASASARPLPGIQEQPLAGLSFSRTASSADSQAEAPSGSSPPLARAPSHHRDDTGSGVID